MKKTILITGVSGFIGGYLVRYFYMQGFEIIGVSRSKNIQQELLNMMTYLPIDLSKDALPKQVDCVINAAGLASDQACWADLYNSNVVAPKRLYAQVKFSKFIHISSSSVYNINKEIHTEYEEINPIKLTNYGKSKLMCDEYLIKNSKSTTYIIRPRAVYGEGDTTLLPKILSIRKGNFYFTPGDLQYNISLTHIHNLIQAVDLCLKDNIQKGAVIYNVADDKTYSLNRVIAKVLKINVSRQLKQVKLSLGFLKLLANALAFLGINTKLNTTALQILCQDNILDIERIKNELGYEAKDDFFDFINQKKIHKH